LSAKGDSFVGLLKNKGFREDNMTKVGLYAIGTYTTLESNKSQEKKLLLGLHQIKLHDTGGAGHGHNNPRRNFPLWSNKINHLAFL
jgi:hypothetical protein